MTITVQELIEKLAALERPEARVFVDADRDAWDIGDVEPVDKDRVIITTHK